ncbi:MAG: class I SAM-dependent methyltransferase [Clostridia bacterium]|nr:class I SAM-dependent methyltransferase [Clostridia bacterium]
MFVSDKWKDYELLDCTDGERLERWGRYILVRPDPQVIWNYPKSDPRWDRADGVYTRKNGGGSWTVNRMPESWCVSYGDMTFRLRPMGFKHTGLFPEQAPNWDWARSLISGRINETGERPRILNLFAYTGAATVACAKGGAEVVQVDASKGMTQAAKENLALSGLGDAPCRFIVDDCKKFCEREIRRQRKYEGIIMDPPSYGRGPGGELWTLEKSIQGIVELAVSLLSDRPLFFLINSYTTGLSPMVMKYILSRTLPEGLRTRCGYEVGETCLKVTNNGLMLPSGASVRASFTY